MISRIRIRSDYKTEFAGSVCPQILIKSKGRRSLYVAEARYGSSGMLGMRFALTSPSNHPRSETSERLSELQRDVFASGSPFFLVSRRFKPMEMGCSDDDGVQRDRPCLREIRFYPEGGNPPPPLPSPSHLPYLGTSL